MGQQQPSSLPHWRTREASVGASNALREAAVENDALSDALGRKFDLRTVVVLGIFALGFVGGLIVGRLFGVVL